MGTESKISRPKFAGTLEVPGDKSISHRALIFSLFAQGECQVSRLSPAEDCQSTIRCLESIGVSIVRPAAGSNTYGVTSPGWQQLKAPGQPLDAGNSGTTIRLLSGVLAGCQIACTLDGDESLRKRPMARVLKPLSEMGASFRYLQKDGCPPFAIEPSKVTGRHFQLQLASAQVQTAILLAGLTAQGETSVTLPGVVRDHTERMFRYIGVPFTQSEPLSTQVKTLTQPIKPYSITVAGDISSAAFFMVAAACAPGSRIKLTDVGMNSGRTLVIDVLREMGAQVSISDQREMCGEPVATIEVVGGAVLGGATISGDRIAAGIDEIPILALAGALCKGKFSVRDAQELRVKESDRLSAIIGNLRAAGADVVEYEDGFDINGTGTLRGGSPWQSFGDHRLAMTGMVGSLLCDEPLSIDDKACAAVSYPHFETDLQSLVHL